MKNMQLDNLLKSVLIPRENPGDELNQSILNQVKETETMKHKKTFAAAAAAALIAATSVTVCAAYHFMSASDMAEKLQDNRLAEHFEEEIIINDVEQVYESQTYGGYEVTLLGLITGDNYSQYQTVVSGEIRSDRTYCAVAIRKEDGTSFGDSMADVEESFFVSPLIGSLNPDLYNAVSLCGGLNTYVEDGVLYQLLECDNIEYFADQNVYLCVTDTVMLESGLYDWNEAEGTIARNREYQGLNALFTLKMDPLKANTEKAKALIEDIDRLAEEGDGEIKMTPEEKEAEDFADNLTAENIDQYCVRMENTVQTVKYAADGAVTTKPFLIGSDEESDGGSYMNSLSLCEGWQDAGLHITGYAYSTGIQDLSIYTFFMNDDGTVTFAVYVPKDVSVYLK